MPVGHNTLAKLMKECADICNYCFKRCTLRGLRSYGITKLVNTSEAVSETDKLIVSRHTNLNTHAHYQRSTTSSLDARYKVFGAKQKNKQEQKPVSDPPLPSSVAPNVTVDNPVTPSPSHSVPVGNIQQYSNISNHVFQANLPSYHYVSPPAPFPMYHPGFGMPGYLPMPATPTFSVLPSNTAQVPLSSPVPQPNIHQTTLSSLQEVMNNLNKKLEEVENKLDKKAE